MKSNETSNQWEIAIRFFFLSIIGLGLLYPLSVTGLAQSLFPFKANGSLVVFQGNVIGSELLAQKINTESLFLYRPSAANYHTLPSGASNLSPSSFDLKTLVEKRKFDLETLGIDSQVCSELLYGSGSGLDPHISVGCAKEQAFYLSRKFNFPLKVLNELINKNTEYPILGIFGTERVNVTKLNVSWKEMKYE
ncbi:potassium-transporting ATPase subunit C [Leptospira congkakensis]|uniref:Potassium-transporting ATPase KdpC subunit n=1 Tax=Leptospira congkakensis TaxID=2484932 RepID=A0A4Z1AIJ2_9LEPT|nr:potassium-transporting ATPase subunit C [Leptospira congkakensis]TGL90939.1 potassium-transporting ATPase subunit C [Leptospira congkakensis]TGL91948.1 potassium-transporting ATPase subunit C [Leptospira congkakensis]TGL98998.1 potassium-transporting ATPase subunit C [Leptospira congkakensis]